MTRSLADAREVAALVPMARLLCELGFQANEPGAGRALSSAGKIRARLRGKSMAFHAEPGRPHRACESGTAVVVLWLSHRIAGHATQTIKAHSPSVSWLGVQAPSGAA